jgi:hypothetical protein
MPVEISDEIAEEAIATLRSLNSQKTADTKTDLRRERAATSLLKLYQTQERYRLRPQTPEDYQRALRHPNQTRAKDLASLTPEQVREMQRLAIGDEYPGRRL